MQDIVSVHHFVNIPTGFITDNVPDIKLQQYAWKVWKIKNQ